MKDRTPLISVVMAVYNADKYLVVAIESILQQTLSDFEFIVIDDGSTDGSLSIINRYADIDNRIKIVSRENKGLPASLNEGIRLAKGKYIARMDADDISLLTRFEEQVLFLEKHQEVGVCGTWAEVFNDEKILGRIRHPAEHEALKVKLLFSVCFVHPTVMIRKQLLDLHNVFYNEAYTNSQDYELWVRMSCYTKFYNIEKVLLRYRDVGTGITKLKSDFIDANRYELVTCIQKRVLKNLGIQNDSYEIQPHFIVSVNDRLRHNNVDMYLLLRHFKRIGQMNKACNQFDHTQLSKVLGKKLIIASMFNFKSFSTHVLPILCSKYFYIGIYAVLVERLKYV